MADKKQTHTHTYICIYALDMKLMMTHRFEISKVDIHHIFQTSKKKTAL